MSEAPQQGEQEQPFVYRNFDQQRDVAAVVALANAVERADRIDGGLSEAELRQWMTRPGMDPERDWLVVDNPQQPGGMIAWASVSRGENDPLAAIYARVHPEWRHRGIGRMLLTALIERERRSAAPAVRIEAEERMPDAVRLIATLGFRQVQYWLELRLEADVPLTQPDWPPDYIVRSYKEVADPDILVEALNRGFIGHWDHHDETREGVLHLLARDYIRQDGIFLAFGPQGEVAGVCLPIINERRNKRRGEQRGYIATLGVVPEYRRHGLGRALLLQAMNWLRENGMGPITLHVYQDNQNAMPLYQGVGMRLYNRSFDYQLDFVDIPASAIAASAPA